MAKAKENLKVEVTQSTADDLRTITVTIAGPEKEFLLPDLLSQRGAIQAYDEALRQAVREATEGYLRGAEELIAGIAAGQKQETREPKAEATAPKPKTNGHEKNTSKRDAKSSEKSEKPTSKPINEAGPAPINAPANAPIAVSASGD